MEAVIFFGRLIFSLFFLLLAQADSIIFSKSIIDYHFKKSQHYIYTAARLNNSEASYQLFLNTQDTFWLKKAARLNHIKSVYQWYLIQKKNQHISQQVWLKQAVNLGHPQATLIKLSELVADKNWIKVSEFQQIHAEVLSNLDADLADEYNEIKSLLAVFTQINAQSNTSIPIKAATNKLNRGKTGSEIKATAVNSEVVLKCGITIQAVVSSKSLLPNAEKFNKAFNDSKLNGLSICFSPPKVMQELSVICTQDKYSRIECSLDQLAQNLGNKISPKSYNHLMVIVNQGDANTRGGLMYLDKNDSEQVFIHELAHWLGYTDEYQIKSKQQQQLCVVNSAKWISRNIFVAPSTKSKQQAEELAGQTLYNTNTCNGTEFNAYKVLPELSFMEYLDLPLSEQYAQYIEEHQDYESLTPVAINFWSFYLSKKDLSVSNTDRQYFNSQYLKWLKVSADQNYPPAMTLLAQNYLEHESYNAAFSLLYDSAKLGNANAQLLLGHGYIEGRWLPQSTVKSAYWYQQAADQNDPYGLYFLAKCYEMGWGCEHSVKKAIGYYKQAKAVGSRLADKRLKMLVPSL